MGDRITNVKLYLILYLPVQLKHPRYTSVKIMLLNSSRYFTAAEPQWVVPSEPRSDKHE